MASIERTLETNPGSSAPETDRRPAILMVCALAFVGALPDRPDFFADLVRGSIGLAEALPFYVLNSTTEWLILPLALALNWQHPRRRRLVLAAFVLWYIHRTWTYAYFVPLITAWAEGTAPLTADQIDQAVLWVKLSWIRNAMDVGTTVLLLLAALIPARTQPKI